MNYPTIMIVTPNGLQIEASLIRMANPRLALAQDKVVMLDDHNIPYAEVDLLSVFGVNDPISDEAGEVW